MTAVKKNVEDLSLEGTKSWEDTNREDTNLYSSPQERTNFNGSHVVF